MLNIAFALTFIFSTIFSPLENFLPQTLIDQGIDRPLYLRPLMELFINVVMPAMAIFLIMVGLRARVWLRTSRGITKTLFIGNLMYLMFPLAQIAQSFAKHSTTFSTLEILAPYFFWPAIMVQAIGLVWLGFRSHEFRNDPPTPEIPPPTKLGKILMVAVLLVPTAGLAWSLLISKDSFFWVTRDDKILFQEYCKHAGEKIYSVPKGVTSVYLDPDMAESFSDVFSGSYVGSGRSSLGPIFLNLRLVEFYETRSSTTYGVEPAEEYERYSLANQRRKPVKEITSEYAVLQKSLIDAKTENRLRLQGTEITVKNLRTNQTISTLTYFHSHRQFKVCGQPGNGNFNVTEFIFRSLNLKRKT